MSLSDSHSDRPACKRCERSGHAAHRFSGSSRPAVGDPTLSGGAYYPKPSKSIIEECNHLNLSSS
jgi:hypothetical protein